MTTDQGINVMQSKNDMMPSTFGGNTGGLVSGATSVQATEGGLSPPQFCQRKLPYRYLRALMKRIERRHGLTPERWQKLQLGTKIILMEEAEEDFKRDMIRKYGTLERYRLHTLKRRGFDSDYDYRNWLIMERNGYESHNEYRLELIQKKGYKTIQEYRRAKGQYNRKNEYEQKKAIAKKHGFDTVHAQQKDWAKRKGTTLAEYQLHTRKNGKVLETDGDKKITQCPKCSWISDMRRGKSLICKDCGYRYRTVSKVIEG